MLYALVAIMGLGLVDSYFISFLGTNELAAIGFIVPVTLIVTNFGLGLGMAVSSLVSKLIGANKQNEASRVVTTGLYLTVILALASILILFAFLEEIFSLIGSDKKTFIPIMDYMHIWVFAAPFVMITMLCSSTFRAIGDTSSSAYIAISMTLSNIILNPILIFGLGPIPALGMTGAALATLIAVIISATFAFSKLYFRERLILLSIPTWRDFSESAKTLLEIAIPAVLANTIVPITAAILTAVVAILGTDAVAAYGVGSRIEAMMLIVVYALSSTLPMFIGQNLGAERKDRVVKAIKLSFRFTILFQLALYLVIALLAEPIASQFSKESNVQQAIALYLWIIPLAYGLSGIVILINVSMNVLDRPKIALYINCIRLIFLYLPFAYVGSHLFGLKGFYISIMLAHCCAYILALIWFKKIMQEIDI